MKNFLLTLNQAFLIINVLLLVLNLVTGAYLMAGIAVLCAALNYMAVKQITNSNKA